MANYQILNHKGEELSASITAEDLATMKENLAEYNCFEWDGGEETNIIEGFAKKLEENTEMVLDNVRIYKLIEEA
jgi:hypothetical protein